jgi:putative copper export protein
MAAYFTCFGTVFMAATLLRGHKVPRSLAWGAWGGALLAGAGWFWLQTADFAGAVDVPDVLAALQIVAADTRFGILLIGRCAALLLAVLCFQFGWHRAAALLAGGGVLAESWLGHGGAMTGVEGAVLLVTSFFHLSAVAVWLGSLPALVGALRRLPLVEAQRVARNFSRYGMISVFFLVITAGIQSISLIGGVAALFSSAYGFAAFFKILALAALVALAAGNKTQLGPAMTAEPARDALLRRIGLEMALGLAAVLAAGLILQLTPPTMAQMAGQ